MANIKNHLNNIKNAMFGKDVRNSIHDAIKQCYDDASVNNDNANMEVKLARGVHNTLNDRLSESDKKQKELSSQLEHKASKNDLDVERKRIDSFTKLEEGSTTGDAELIDGRIGEDGIIYENIGGAIRNQFNKMSKQLLMEDIPFDIVGYYLNKEGEPTELGGWGMSDFIKVNKGDIVQVTALGYESNVSAIYLYNNSKDKVKPLQISGNTLQTYTVIVDQDGFIRCSGKRHNNLKGTILRINPQVTNNYNEYINNFSLDISLNNWNHEGYIVYKNGTVESHTDYSYTDYIDIYGLEGLYVYVTEYYDYQSGIAFYDENKKYIGGIGAEINNGENPNMGQLKEIQLKGHYMRLSCRTFYLHLFKLYTSISQVAKSFRYKEVVNPCFYTENLNLIKMFNKIVCIGDSYTEGSIEYKTNDGEKLQSADKRYSYPTQLSKIANVETVNLGRSGYTTTEWYRKYQDTDLSGYDCAIIFLGINDWYKNGHVLDTESYTNIINKLRSDNKNIPIFCVTITKNYLTSAYTLNDKIKEVAINNNCYIIDLGEYSDWTEGSKWLNGSHPNAYGYYHNAEMINSYINYIIDHNKANFYNLSFVGTDKIDF